MGTILENCSSQNGWIPRPKMHGILNQLVRLKFERDYNRIKLLKLKIKVIGISDKYDITKRYPALH